MKRIMALLLVVLVGALLLAGCGGTSNGQPEAPDRLSAAEAEALVTEWLEEHPDMATPYEPTTIAGMADEMFEYDGEDYYLFDLNGYYWISILVHAETGEMVSRFTEEADEPVEPYFELLEDFYDRSYSD